MFIDEAFEDICQSRLERKWGRISSRGRKELMKTQWELGLKPQFMPEDGKTYVVTLPHELFLKASEKNDLSTKPIIKDGRIHFSR